MALALVAVLAIPACSSTKVTSSASSAPTTTSGSTSGSSPHSASTPVCRARDELRSSLQALRDVDVKAGGANAVRDALDRVRTAVADLDAAAHTQYGVDVARVNTALDQLGSTISTLGSSSASSALRALRTSLTEAGGAVEDLLSKVSSGC